MELLEEELEELPLPEELPEELEELVYLLDVSTDLGALWYLLDVSTLTIQITTAKINKNRFHFQHLIKKRVVENP